MKTAKKNARPAGQPGAQETKDTGNVSSPMAEVNPPPANSALEEITRLHQEILSAARTSLEKAIRVGELLSTIKGNLKHGEWLPWLAANVPFTDRTARNYLRVFQNRDRLKSESVSDLADAYRLLAPPAPSAPEPGERTTPAVSVEPSQFIPPPGCSLSGYCYTPGKGSYSVHIDPSYAPGFFYVSVLWDQGRDFTIGCTVEGSIKPIRQDRIEHVLKSLVRQTDILDTVEWDSWPDDPHTFNMFLYSDHQDYVDRAILGKDA